MMKKIFSFILTITLLILLVGCGSKGSKTKEDDLYFDYTGIAEVTSIVYTDQDTFDLKEVFKVGNRMSSYNKKIGETTYDDIYFSIYEWGSSDVVTENDDAKINDDLTITRKRLSTVVVTADLKVDVDVSEEERYNRGLHVLTIFFGNDKTFGTWEAPNEYLDLWIENKIKDGETDAKKAVITLEFREDFSYTITITGGYWGDTGYDNKIESKTITGKLFGSCSAGAVRHDDDKQNDTESFTIGMNSYYYGEDDKYTLFTALDLYNKNTYYSIRFLPKEAN